MRVADFRTTQEDFGIDPAATATCEHVSPARGFDQLRICQRTPNPAEQDRYVGGGVRGLASRPQGLSQDVNGDDAPPPGYEDPDQRAPESPPQLGRGYLLSAASNREAAQETDFQPELGSHHPHYPAAMKPQGCPATLASTERSCTRPARARGAQGPEGGGPCHSIHRSRGSLIS